MIKAALHLRAATPADRPFVEGVYFETQRALIEQLFGWRGDDIERSKFDEFYDEAATAIVEAGGEPIGWLTVFRDVNTIELQSIYISTAKQRRGIGTYLLKRLIAQANAGGKTIALSTAKINPARRLYERLGFVAVDESEFKVYMVRAPHDGQPIEIREESAADVDGVRAVHDAAFGRVNEGHLIDKLREERLIVASIVAIENGAAIGSAVFSRLSVRDARESISAVALAPVAVTPEYQSRGTGARIVRYGLAVCAQRDHDAVFVLGDPRYYSRFGFSHELARTVRSPYSHCGQHWMALELRKSSLSAGPFEARYPAAFHAVD